ncbi:MAG: hypothetical protein JWM88_1590 [Verrucomicrobia bacterium]|nr:hypothetical protein [Verrucomicrobiota bacterium]
MSDELPARIVSEITFIGRGGGRVKALSGFRKGHHTVPDAANPVTNGFLAKISSGELAAEAERLFQEVRTRLNLKRKDAALSVAPGFATLTARDFIVEIQYVLDDLDPGRYAVTTTLRGLKSAALAATAEFDAIFRSRFGEISFLLTQGARVEEIVDVIEALEGKGGLGVTYPSDCSECVIAVDGVDARVRCTSSSLQMIFPRPGSPRDLMAGFAAVRGAFGVSRELSGVLG